MMAVGVSLAEVGHGLDFLLETENPALGTLHLYRPAEFPSTRLPSFLPASFGVRIKCSCWPSVALTAQDPFPLSPEQHLNSPWRNNSPILGPGRLGGVVMDG